MQTKVAFIVPYFGRFPSNFQLWLNSCAWNSDFYWLVFTDDRTCYNYPKNVSITYLTFEEMQKKYHFLKEANQQNICKYIY